MKLCILLIFASLFPHARAAEFSAPVVPDTGEALMPESTDNLSQGLYELLQNAFSQLYPNLADALRICVSIVIVILLVRFMGAVSEKNKTARDLVCCTGISLLFLESADSLISLATGTIEELSDYGRLLIPVMASAMAAQGGVTGSGALYSGTLIFDSLLSTLISNILVPLNYVFLALSVCGAALNEEILKKLAGGIKWLCTLSLKTILYVFTGYIGITGVVSGTTDAAALKAAKLTISGVVPVVGGILSDASEAVLVSAGLARNAAGIYGILAMFAVALGPFLRIGTQYLLMKGATFVSQILGEKSHSALMEAFCTSMGLLLAMTGSVCILMLVSVVCFLQGVG